MTSDKLRERVKAICDDLRKFHDVPEEALAPIREWADAPDTPAAEAPTPVVPRCRQCGGTRNDHMAPDGGGCPGDFTTTKESRSQHPCSTRVAQSSSPTPTTTASGARTATCATSTNTSETTWATDETRRPDRNLFAVLSGTALPVASPRSTDRQPTQTMIFYIATWNGQSGQTANEFHVRKDEATKQAKEAHERPSTIDARVIKIDAKGHHQMCELLNYASGVLPALLDDAEVLWRGKPKRATKADEDDAEDLLS